MERITATIRDQLLRSLEHQFQPRWEELEKQEKHLAQVAYFELLDADTIKGLEALPDGWVPISGAIYVRYDPEENRLKLDLPEPKRHPASIALRLDGSRSLQRNIRALKDARQELRAEQQAALEQARAVITSVTTTQRLREIWPEIGSLLDQVVGQEKAKGGALSVPLAQLNSTLGLPVEDENAE